MEDLIEANDISDFNVVEIFKTMSLITQEDCDICNKSPEIQEISMFTELVYSELQSMIGNILFKNQSLERTSDTNILFEKLPESIKTRVESASNIVESFNKGRQNTADIDMFTKMNFSPNILSINDQIKSY